MEVGEIVKLIQPVIQGEIKDTEYNKDTKTLKHLVEYIGSDGETHTRWFDENQLEQA